MTATTEPSARRQSFLDKPIVATLVINWELVLYALLFLLAMASRFYDLGARVMSHDESLHALFSFKLYDGDGYRHDPLMHGPLQFHLVALSYLLFGDNDFSARIPAALFGVALVMLPYWFRPWLGRLGALVTSFGLLISPVLLYYDRYIRNESYIALFTAMLALSLFRYMRTRRQSWLYVGAAAVSLSLSTKEVAFIHGFIGVVFIAVAFACETLPRKNLRRALTALLVVTGALFLGALFFSGFAPEDSAFNGRKLAGVLLMVAGLAAGVLTIALNTDRAGRPVSAAVKPLLNVRVAFELLTGPVLAAAALFFLLHTTFFTNPAGFATGTWGAVSYWLKQQEVARGGQPGYYYLLLMPLYEFLPLFLGGIGGLVYLFKKAPDHTVRAAEPPAPQDPPAPSDGGTFAAYLIFWAIGSFVIYSWAGEKMPWLTVHITLPFIFLLGHVSQTVFDRFDGAVLKTRPGLLFALLLPVFGALLLVLFSARP
ncbi:MAG: flippase activity-associated protein Agl23, partial [Anaerolineae bacterium]